MRSTFSFKNPYYCNQQSINEPPFPIGISKELTSATTAKGSTNNIFTADALLFRNGKLRSYYNAETVMGRSHERTKESKTYDTLEKKEKSSQTYHSDASYKVHKWTNR